MFLSVVMPAFKAQNTIIASVHSALAQTHKNFELVISCDDQFNYEELLRENAINDARLVFTDTGAIGTGSSNARNIGINKAKGRYIVVLDADDQFVPTKLELVAKALEFHPLVTTGLEVVTNKGEYLRQVGCAGKNRKLSAGAYKFTNISMDSMVAHDREKIPVEYDVELPCLVDLGLMLSAFCHVDGSFHLALPLHRYFKQVQSISMGPEASQRYVRIKRLLLDRLRSGFYPLAGGTSAQSGLISFLELSLKAENQFDAAKRRKSDLLFEDHLESRLRDFTG
jgi:succinoglycan biosynthesis protein ExoO